MPPVVELAREHGVAVGTAHRALTLLKDWGLVDASRGRRATVRPTTATSAPTDLKPAGPPVPATPGEDAVASVQLLDLEIRHHDQVVANLTTKAQS